MELTRTSDGLPQREDRWKPMIKLYVRIGNPEARHFEDKSFVFSEL